MVFKRLPYAECCIKRLTRLRFFRCLFGCSTFFPLVTSMQLAHNGNDGSEKGNPKRPSIDARLREDGAARWQRRYIFYQCASQLRPKIQLKSLDMVTSFANHELERPIPIACKCESRVGAAAPTCFQVRITRGSGRSHLTPSANHE